MESDSTESSLQLIPCRRGDLQIARVLTFRRCGESAVQFCCIVRPHECAGGAKVPSAKVAATLRAREKLSSQRRGVGGVEPNLAPRAASDSSAGDATAAEYRCRRATAPATSATRTRTTLLVSHCLSVHAPRSRSLSTRETRIS